LIYETNLDSDDRNMLDQLPVNHVRSTTCKSNVFHYFDWTTYLVHIFDNSYAILVVFSLS